MEIKNNIQIPQEKANYQPENKKNSYSDEFQKEVDKKIKEENKDKKQSDSKEEKIEKNQEEKPRVDTRDLTTLKLFVLPYVNKDILSVNIRESLYSNDLSKNNKQNNIMIDRDEKLFKSFQDNILLDTTEQKKNKTNLYNPDFNPFSAFEKLNNTLKEISKEEKIKESRIIRELIEKLDVQKLKDSRQVEIRFDRENIGNLNVKIINQDNKVTVVFKTSSKFIYDELKNNRDLLKSMLESRDLKAEKIVVDYEEVV